MDIPKVRSLQEWTRRENKLGNPALKTEIERTDDPVLTQALAWSLAVNASIDEMVHNLPPFPYVQKTLEKCQMLADLVVISSTPDERLIHEWTEQGLAGYVRLIVGQEMGSKKEHLSMAANGRYTSTHILVIGDAPGDLKAARANQALFYPIQPGCEEESWERFHKEAFLKFINKSYAGEYQTELIHAFLAVLPEKPSWDDRE